MLVHPSFKMDGYESVESAYEDYSRYAHNMGFSCRIKSRNFGRKDKTRYYYATFVCNKEGFKAGSAADPKNKETSAVFFPDCKGKKTYQRRETRTGCRAKIIFHYLPSLKRYAIFDIFEEHNHPLHPPEDKSRLKSNRKVDGSSLYLAEVNRQAGISLRSSFDMMNTIAGGQENLGFMKTDLKNALANERRRYKMAFGEGNIVMKYLIGEYQSCPDFYYDVEMDSENSIMNIFWSDSQMRVDYSLFGDCISLDTTYRTNRQSRPLGMYMIF